MASGGKDERGSGERKSLSSITTAELNILLSLAGGDLHGYGIKKEVEHRTDGATSLGPGTLYRSIKQMLSRGWIEEVGEEEDPELGGGNRRLYRLTNIGQQAAALEVQRLEELVERAHERGIHSPDPGPETGSRSSQPGLTYSPLTSFSSAGSSSSSSSYGSSGWRTVV